MQSAHNLDVERLQGVASGLNEVDAGMDAIINDVHPVDLVFCLKVCIEPLLNVFNDRSPRIIVVYEVTETWGVHNGQPKAYAAFFNVCTDRLDRNSFWDDVEAGSFTFSRRIERGVEKSVDKCRFSESRLACIKISVLRIFGRSI